MSSDEEFSSEDEEAQLEREFEANEVAAPAVIESAPKPRPLSSGHAPRPPPGPAPASAPAADTAAAAAVTAESEPEFDDDEEAEFEREFQYEESLASDVSPRASPNASRGPSDSGSPRHAGLGAFSRESSSHPQFKSWRHEADRLKDQVGFHAHIVL